jgi:hypothetical protein
MLEQRIETDKRVRRSNVSNVRPINYDSWDALKEKLVGMMASFDMRLVEYERARLAKRRSEWTGLGNGQPYANAGGWVSVANGGNPRSRGLSATKTKSRPDPARFSPGEAFVRPP